MITLTSLWMPIVIATVLAFVAGSVLHMLVGHHRHDFRAAPNEQAALQALTALNLAPGEYYVPHPMSTGPNNPGISVLMTVIPPGGIRLATSLTQWVIYQLLITFICAYVASRTLPAGAPYLSVFRVVGTSAFMAYSFAHAHDSIWWKRSWGTSVRYMFDGLIYALLMAGVFGWLWPR
jgi:hypothetical protein